MGDINSHLLAFEQSLAQPSAPAQDLATTIMVFMVQGLFSSLSFPYAQFPCHKVTGQLLFDPFWEAIFRLERLGLKVKVYFVIIAVIPDYFCRFSEQLLMVPQ